MNPQQPQQPQQQPRKEGVSVKEIEEFTKKYRLEVFFCILFILSCIFSDMFLSLFWSIIGVTLGAVLGVLLSYKIDLFSKSIFNFVFRQDKTTQIVLGVVSLIIAIFLPCLVFFLLGIHGGKSMYHKAMTTHNLPRS